MNTSTVKRFRLVEPVYLTLVLILMYIPIIIVVVNSFNLTRSGVGWSGFTLHWYADMVKNRGLMDSLKNSVILALLSCGLSTVIGTIGAVGLVRIDIKRKGLLEGIISIPIMIPEIILGMAFLTFFSFIGIPFGMLTLVLAHTSFCVAYIFIIVKSRLAGIDKSVGEAARDLGASNIRMLFDITLPLIMPGIISGALLAFAMSLDDVIISFFATGPEVTTLPIKIYSQLRVGITPEINALCTVILGGTFIIIGLTQVIGARDYGKS